MQLLYHQYIEVLRHRILFGLCVLLIAICCITFAVNYSRNGFSLFAGINLFLVLFYSFCLFFIGKKGVQFWNKASFFGLPNFFFSYLLIWLLAARYVAQSSSIKQKIMVHSTRDYFTGALNRFSLKQRIENYKFDEHLTICLIDVDHFKQINDKFGHGIGDQVLVRLVGIISEKTSKSQVYRIGGEEFVILFYDELLIVIKKAEAILASVSVYDYQDIHHKLTLSFSGGAVELAQRESLSEVLKRADTYLYQAKSSGRNKIVSELSDL